MGRHGGAKARRPRLTGTIVVLVLLVAGAVALGLWWARLGAKADPVAADPVSGYGIVVASPPCTDAANGGVTTVTVVGSTIQATLDACGYRQGQRLAIEYLRGHPETARLAGTSTGTQAIGIRKVLPYVILGVGLLAVAAAILLIRERRSGHRQQRAATERVTVAELQAAAAAAASARAAEPRPSFTVLSPGRSPEDTDPGTGEIPAYGARTDLLNHAGDTALLTHVHADEVDTSDPGADNRERAS
jgi:hypothetical protein